MNSTTPIKILLAEDDPELGKIIPSMLLSRFNCEVALCVDGEIALKTIRRWEPNITLLDLGLPKLHGLEVLKQAITHLPTCRYLIISAAITEHEKMCGFDYGADDYLTKPFCMNELFARVRALLRRSKVIGDDHLIFGDICLYKNARRVVRNGVRMHFTMKEFAILYYLAERAGRVVSRSDLIDAIWIDKIPNLNTVDAHIESIRRKFDYPFAVSTIKTAYRQGYYFEPANT